jgi:nicotinamide mononucleotide (NMN) deamidase PncC
MNNIKQLILSKLTWLERFILSLFERGIVEYLEELLPAAIGIVTKLMQNNTLTSEQKRTEAVKQLGDSAKSIGIDVGLSVLNLAVEMALQKVKAYGDKTN